MVKLTRFIAIFLAVLCLTGCRRQTGWIRQDGKTVYADENGKLVTGWLELDGSIYYFGSDNAMATGWHTVDGNRHFFSQDGKLCSGWVETDSGTYYLLENGIPVTGWMSGGDTRYYFGADGAMTRGWAEIGGDRYYFGPDGVMATGTLQLDGIIYLLGQDGKALTGWQTLDGRVFYCSPGGAMARGWTDIGGKRYYFQENGALATGKLELEGKTYLLGQDGVMYTGWYTEEDKDYYYQPDGAMSVGKVLLDGQAYYFSPHGVHVMLVNPWNSLPADYDPDLVKVEFAKMSRICADALVQMLEDCRAAGYNPAICSGYRTQEEQEFLFNRKIKRVMAEGYDEEEAKILAAKEVAVPGTSEHQLGLAIDLVDDDHWVLDKSQAERPTQKWLMEHCWEYGFILRYPVGSTEITGIIYEPWHYRYVGVEIALELRELGITLEEYLGAADHE